MSGAARSRTDAFILLINAPGHTVRFAAFGLYFGFAAGINR